MLSQFTSLIVHDNTNQDSNTKTKKKNGVSFQLNPVIDARAQAKLLARARPRSRSFSCPTEDVGGYQPRVPHFGTLAIHAGQDPDQWASKSIIPMISLSSTYKLAKPGEDGTGFLYSRVGNPTRNVTQNCIAALEGGKHCFLFSSGLASITAVTQLLKAGDHIIAMEDLYGGTNRLLIELSAKYNVEVAFVDCTDAEKVKEAMRPNTRMVYLETPTNPLLRIVDIAEVSAVAHSQPNVVVAVDNTFMTPFFQRPLSLGADIVVHSITKYMNGHTDVVMGGLIVNDESLKSQLEFIQMANGAVPSPFDCYLVNRGLKTLHLRMREHMKNGLTIARYLERNERVEKVIHPGLPSHPFYERAKKQTGGCSGIISFYIKGGLQEATTFLGETKVFTLAVSLGGYESLAEHPASMTHVGIPKAERDKLGITENMIRLSVGIENSEDLIADLQQALAAAVTIPKGPPRRKSDGAILKSMCTFDEDEE